MATATKKTTKKKKPEFELNVSFEKGKLNKAFGISDERAAELTDIYAKVFMNAMKADNHEESSKTYIFKTCVDACETLEEVVYVTHTATIAAEKLEKKLSLLEGLTDVLK